MWCQLFTYKFGIPIYQHHVRRLFGGDNNKKNTKDKFDGPMFVDD